MPLQALGHTAGNGLAAGNQLRHLVHAVLGRPEQQAHLGLRRAGQFQAKVLANELDRIQRVEREAALRSGGRRTSASGGQRDYHEDSDPGCHG
jgi:hypothetical protein